MDELHLLRETARSLLERAAPMTRVRELGGALDQELWRRIAEAGWLATAVPSSAGDGGGARLAEISIVVEELGRTLAASAFVPSVVAARALVSAGEPGAEALEQIAAGEATATVCVAEPEDRFSFILAGMGMNDSSSSPQERTTPQSCVASDGTVTGRKVVVPDAADARWLMVAAHAGTAPGLFLVDGAGGGVKVHPSTSLDLTRRFAEVELSNAPAQPVGDARAVRRMEDEGAALVCAETVGAASRLLEMTTAYARERIQFGRPIGSFQAVKHRCANMLVALEASAATTQTALRALDASTPDAPREVSAAKAYVGDACATLAADALQVHGGIGFTWELDVHLYLRRIRANRALFGTPSWHRERLWTFAAS